MNDLIFVDEEASGLDLESYPIEIAIQVNGQIFSWLIAPEPSWMYWDKNAEAMHGVTREMLLKKGLDAKYVANEINNLL